MLCWPHCSPAQALARLRGCWKAQGDVGRLRGMLEGSGAVGRLRSFRDSLGALSSGRVAWLGLQWEEECPQHLRSLQEPPKPGS